MRILLINQYAGAPTLGMQYRPHWMAVEWQRLGHEVLVVAGSHSHVRSVQPPSGRSRIEGVEFLTLDTPKYSDNGLQRFLSIMAFRTQLYRRSGSLADWRPDAVIASSIHPMDIRPALRVARKVGAVLVHEVHDLWPLTPKLLGGMSDRHPMVMWMQREEDLACREADLVVSLLPATLPYLQSRGLEAGRWTHVSNGVPDTAVSDATQCQYADGPTFRVGYFGAHGPANDLGTLIEAARQLQGEDVEVHLWGAGPAKSPLQARAADIPTVHFHDSVPPAAARASMASMDALYIGLVNSPLFQHGVSPNKMFDYMAAGRPIIQAIDTPRSPADEAGCAIRCRPGDPGAVIKAINELRGLGLQKRTVMGTAGQAYVRDTCTYSRLAASFAEAMETAQSRQMTSA